jgi:hypothetical protein
MFAASRMLDLGRWVAPESPDWSMDNVSTGRKPMKLLTKTLMLTAAATLMMAGSARADSISYTFTSDHCSGGCGPQSGGFGSVVLTQDGTSVDFVVTLFNGNEFVQTGAGDFEIFKFNDSNGITASNVTISPYTPGLQFDKASTPGGFNGDGTGQFTYGISCPSCPNGGAGKFYNGPIMFSISNSSLANFLGTNNLGQVFVADILSGTSGMTGPVDASIPDSVPDGGSTMILLGSSLLALGLLRRKFGRI